MVVTESTLVTLVRLVDRMPMPKAPCFRGRPPVYSDRLFVKALVIMVVRRLSRVHELLRALEQPTPEMRLLRQLLSENGRYPSRRTFERRLSKIPQTLPAQIGLLGRYLVFLLEPWKTCGRAVAIDSTLLRALGPVWHNKHKRQGIVPHSRIDTQAAWTFNPWHGWVYGWKLHMVSLVGPFWLPLCATCTTANIADNTEAENLLPHVPPETRFVLGDQHYDAANVHKRAERSGRLVIASRKGGHPHTGEGVQVRRLFHRLRSVAIENLNGHFKDLFGLKEHVPTRGQTNTARFVLGAVLVYQLALWLRFEQGTPLPKLNQDLKAFLRAA